MLWTFRLLLVYAVFDSIHAVMNGVFMAVGKPAVLHNTRLIQAAFFIPAVIFGAQLAGINGVAIAADGVLFVRACFLYRPLNEVIDLKVGHLIWWPVLALSSTNGFLHNFRVNRPYHSVTVRLYQIRNLFSSLLGYTHDQRME
jgi:hypothetical protein